MQRFMMALLEQLMAHEDFRSQVYDDQTGEPIKKGSKVHGYPTIGIGRNLAGKGINASEGIILATNDIQEVLRYLSKRYPRFHKFGFWRQVALADMRFNLGATGFEGFKDMHDAILREQWELVRAAALDSKWADQVGPIRSGRIAHELQRNERKL